MVFQAEVIASMKGLSSMLGVSEAQQGSWYSGSLAGEGEWEGSQTGGQYAILRSWL